MKIHQSIVGVGVILCTIPGTVLAQSPEAAEGFSPDWFPLLEIGGAIIAAFAIVYVRRALRSLGGHIGEQFRLILRALSFIFVAFVLRAGLEFWGYEGFVSELLFELPFYAAVIFIAQAATKLARVMSGK